MTFLFITAKCYNQFFFSSYFFFAKPSCRVRGRL